MSSFPLMSFTIFFFDFSFFSSLLTLFVGPLPEPVAAITLYSCFSAALSLCLAPPDCACSIKSSQACSQREIEALKIFVAETKYFPAKIFRGNTRFRGELARPFLWRNFISLTVGIVENLAELLEGFFEDTACFRVLDSQIGLV